MLLDVPMDELARLIEVILDTIDNPKQVKDNCSTFNIIEYATWVGPMSDREFTAIAVTSTIIGAYLEGRGITGDKIEATMRIVMDLQSKFAKDPDFMPTYQKFIEE